MSDETHLKDQDGFQEKYLWEDPLLDNEQFRDKIGPVLLAEEIHEYTKKYGLLVADDFMESDLKGASYYMRPDPNEAWIFYEKDQEVQQVRLAKKNEEDKQYYLLPQNSLVYIRLQQKLRLPYYIIGRHNLIIPYVYQGLLLGTGPQVDPGYIGNLFIPLHNLTNRDAKIYLNDWFVSIDFVRTSTLNLMKGSPETDTKFRELYPEKRPIHRGKLERMQLEDYLKKAKPISSLGIYVSKLDEFEKKASEAQNRLDEKINDSTNKLNEEIRKADKAIAESTSKSENAITRIESLRRFEIIALIVLFFIFLTGWFVSYYHLDSKLESKTQSLIKEVKTQLPSIQKRLIELDQSLQKVVKRNTFINKFKSKEERDAYYLKIDSIRGTLSDLGGKVEQLERKVTEIGQNTGKDK